MMGSGGLEKKWALDPKSLTRNPKFEIVFILLQIKENKDG
jgi:hypothetical protein